MAIFDVAGTTAQDDGLVVDAFRAAMATTGIAKESLEMKQMVEYVVATMGQRKFDVFRHLCAADLTKANLVHDHFIREYSALIGSGKLKEFDGVSALFTHLRESGTAVALTTGFPREILDRLMIGLNWTDIVDFSVAASEVAQGRPAPDMIFRAMELFNRRFKDQIRSNEIAVIGDTESDIEAGVSAGVEIVAGVTTGVHSAEQLISAGATHVLERATLFSTIC